MRLIYVPIADSFFESSIMQEELAVRFVMLALIRLALRAGADGVVDMDPRVFAASINLPLADVERAIKRLMEPDDYSGCPDEEGRRIMPVDPERPMRGWRLVNWAKYRKIVHLSADAARKREKRTEADTADMSANGATNTRTRTRTRTTTKTKERAHAAEAQAPPPFAPPSLEEVQKEVSEKGYAFDPELFWAHYGSIGWFVGRVRMKDWKAACLKWETDPREFEGARVQVA